MRRANVRLSLAGMVGSFIVLFAAILAIVGTDRLGRALTNEERAVFGKLLREHGYVGGRSVALRFAYKLARSRTRAQDLMGRSGAGVARAAVVPSRVERMDQRA